MLCFVSLVGAMKINQLFFNNNNAAMPSIYFYPASLVKMHETRRSNTTLD